ncbi:MAG TPA: biotin/lipoyl-containing protein [Rhodothermales bacterium]|nr:biotin/lipoyl-containing protein [Rhodothermales bacterium]
MQNGPIKAVVNGSEIELDFQNEILTADGAPVDASIVPVGGSTYSLLLNGRSYEVTIQTNGDSTHVTESGLRSEVVILDRASILLATLAGKSASKRHALEIRAPMPGLVLAVEVEANASVIVGQGIVVLEAMKMENEIFSSGAGAVEKVYVAKGDAVTKGQLLVTLVAP